MTRGMPEQALAYFGPASKLREHVTAMLAGKEVVITAVTHGTQHAGILSAAGVQHNFSSQLLGANSRQF